ncbi:MAG: N-acetyl-1-D-myo-inositol-2-amino-2-deoxy-alpha-D-glucopyranoside deacetylase [Arachnia sp.]
MTEPARLLLVHAHPDDESSQSSATMARYVAEGAAVTLVTCTLGERGEILVPEWEHLSEAELGAVRTSEIATALAAVGVSDHVWLGGAGRYHDTGMDRDEAGSVIAPADAPENAFWKADLLEAANHLVEIIRDRRPQVIATYDPFGGYGHPDHIQAHRVTMYAAVLAGIASHRPDLGPAWHADRVLWFARDFDRWLLALDIAAGQGIYPFGREGRPPAAMAAPAPAVHAAVETAPWLAQATAALAAHRSQVDPGQDFWRFFDIMRSTPGAREAFTLASGRAFPEAQGPADDIFAGLR